MVYLDHLAEVEGFIDDCEVILDQLQGAMGLVRELEANAGFVEECESALRGACERLLDEQVSRTRETSFFCSIPTFKADGR